MRSRVALALGGAGPRSCEHVQPRLGVVRVLEVALLARAEPGDRRVGVLAEQLPQLGDASTRRSVPRRPRSRRRARSRSRPRGRASRAAPSRACRGRPRSRRALAARPASRAGRRARAARCRRASSRSAAPSRWHRRCSARTRRRSGRGCRRWPSRAACRSAIACSPRSSRNSITEACGNFGAPPKPPLRASKVSRQLRHRVVERARVERLGGWRQQRAAGQALAQALAARADLLAVLAPGLGDRLQHLRPGGHPVAGLGREVGAAVERQLLGREEHVQRPAAVAGHALHGLHVERVDVGALLAVDLHAHEALVHQRGRARVLEGLALHHVAPVAGGVADRDQQRLVLLARARERRRRPTAASRRGSRRAGAGRARSRRRARWARVRRQRADAGRSSIRPGKREGDRMQPARRLSRCARESLTFAMLTLKRLPASMPVTCLPGPSLTVPPRGVGARDADRPPTAAGRS